MMKTPLLLLLLFISVFSQAQKNNNPETANAMESTVPTTHKVYSMSQYSLEEADSFYRSNIAEEGADVKNVAFSFMMEKGLAEKGTDEQKEYYVNQQLEADNNITAIDEFYALLLSCRNFMPKNDLTKNSTAFYDKNKAAINKIKWPEVTQKNEKIKELMKEYKIFNRYIAVAMKE